jgi:hypothetical protein
MNQEQKAYLLTWIDNFIEGIKKCFPEIYYGPKIGRNYSPQRNWNKKDALDFADEVMKWTGKYSLEESLTELTKWKQKLEKGLPPDPNMPPAQLLKEYLELEKQKEDSNKFTAEKAKKNQELLIERYKEKVEKEKDKVKSQATEKEIKPPPAERIIINEIYGPAPGKIAAEFSTLPRTAFFALSSRPEALLLRKGIKSEVLKEKIPTLEERKRLELDKLIANLEEIEKTFPGYVQQIKPLSPKDISLLISTESGLTQGQVALMIRPPEQGGMMAIPHRSFIGSFATSVGKQLFGKLVDKGISKAIAGTAGRTAGKAAVVATGTAIGPGIGTAVSLLASKTLGKLGDWIREHKELAVGIGLSTLGIGFILAGLPLVVGIVPLAFGGLGLLGAVSGGLSGIGQNVGGFINALHAGFTTVVLPAIGTPLLIGTLSVPILIMIILFIINTGAYVVPPREDIYECEAENVEKPTATGILYSDDGKYAYPLAPANAVGEDCRHWDNTLATDIFPIGGNGTHAPVIAYTSGVVEGISLNDSKGGKYIILAGGDGRFYYFAHNCAMFVKEGDRVNVGDVIATTDRTGSAATTPEHLHFAINSLSPDFVGGGDICPSEDFALKFSSYNRCSKNKRCAVK